VVTSSGLIYGSSGESNASPLRSVYGVVLQSRGLSCEVVTSMSDLG